MSEKHIMVSVKCLAYNHEKYIRKALDGFVMQKTAFPFEVIVHDDASTDRTASIIREYEMKYPDIIKPIYETTNQYRTGNLNKRIINPRMQGKYIAFCEGDDYWIDPYKLQKQVDYLEAHPECAFSFHNSVIIWENGRIKEKGLLPDPLFKSKVWNNSNRVYDASELIELGFIPTASIVGRREYVINVRSFCPKQVCGDLPLRLSMSLDGNAYYINECMSAYRTGNANSATGRAMNNQDVTKRNLLGHIEILNGFDKASNYCFHEVIEKDIKKRKLRYYMSVKDNEQIHKDGLYEFMKREVRVKGRMKYFAYVHFSGLYEAARMIRNKVKRI